MNRILFKKLVTAIVLSLSMALTVPSVLPLTTDSNVVTVEAAKVKLSKKSATMLAGQKIKLKVKHKGKKSVKWSTSNKKVATVKKGVITATGKGKATITAKVGKKKLKCKIKVKKNSYSFNPSILSNSMSSGYFYFVPSKAYYKNGKLYCKINVVNKTGHKIKFIGDRKGNTPSKLYVTLTAKTFSSLINPSDTSTVLAKGKVKVSLPKNIKSNKSKSFTVVFSGKQIKKKGFQLSAADFINFNAKKSIYSFR